MEINQSEGKDLAIAFSQRYLNLLNDKKHIDADIKELKQEFDEQGCPTKMVVKAINNLKRAKKITSSQASEIEMFETWLSENKDIDDSLTELTSKDA